MQSFGPYLKSEREKRGVRLEEIASITKIHLHNLQLMEQDKWDQLPPKPFIQGFVTAYAKYVGLDTKEVLEKFSRATGEVPIEHPTESGLPAPTPAEVYSTDTQPMEIVSTTPPRAKKDKNLNFRALIKICALVLLALGFWISKRRADGPMATPQRAANPPGEVSAPVEAPTTAPIQVEEKKNAEVSAVASGVQAPNSEAAKPELVQKDSPPPSTVPLATVPKAQQHELIVMGKDRTWIKVVIDDAPPIEYFLGQGEKANYTANHKIKIVLGNSTGTQVFHNGEPTPGVKFQGTIRSYIFPSDAHFPQDNVKRLTTTTSESTPEPPGQDEE